MDDPPSLLHCLSYIPTDFLLWLYNTEPHPCLGIAGTIPFRLAGCMHVFETQCFLMHIMTFQFDFAHFLHRFTMCIGGPVPCFDYSLDTGLTVNDTSIPFIVNCSGFKVTWVEVLAPFMALSLFHFVTFSQYHLLACLTPRFFSVFMTDMNVLSFHFIIVFCSTMFIQHHPFDLCSWNIPLVPMVLYVSPSLTLVQTILSNVCCLVLVGMLGY